MVRKSSKQAILDAAERVIIRHGLAGTTIEGVAAEAGISKGGLFYHFASKRELLLQLMARYQNNLRLARQEIYDTLPVGPGRLIKATVLASLRYPKKKAGSGANIVSLLDDMEIRSLLVEARHKLIEELAAQSGDSRHPEKVALATLVTDGMWLMDIFGYSFPGISRDAIIDELLRVIDLHATQPGEAPVES